MHYNNSNKPSDALLWPFHELMLILQLGQDLGELVGDERLGMKIYAKDRFIEPHLSSIYASIGCIA